jgi:ribose/xylose/arabinose/galactoside ABC-type transport system permease subunit
MQEIGKTLITFGIILIGLGLVLTLMHKVPYVGRLPGDIYIQRKNFTFYFPLATSILISIILSLIFWLWSRR